MNTFNNAFYIRQVNDNRYLLLLQDTHYCMCASTLEHCLKMVTKYVVRYKTLDRLLKTVSAFTDKGKVSETTLVERIDWFDTDEWLRFNNDVISAVKEGYEVIENNRPVKKIRKLLGKRKPNVNKVTYQSKFATY